MEGCCLQKTSHGLEENNWTRTCGTRESKPHIFQTFASPSHIFGESKFWALRLFGLLRPRTFSEDRSFDHLGFFKLLCPLVFSEERSIEPLDFSHCFALAYFRKVKVLSPWAFRFVSPLLIFGWSKFWALRLFELLRPRAFSQGRSFDPLGF